MEVFSYLVGAIAAVAWIAACAFSNVSHHRDLSIWTYSAAAIFTIIGATAWYQDRVWKLDAVHEAELKSAEADGPALSLSAITTLMTPDRRRALFWMVPRSASPTAIPLSVLVSVRLTNTGHEPIRIDGYSIESNIDGKWVPSASVDIRNADVFNVNFGFDKAVLLDFSKDGFDTQIEQRAILPNDRVDGWMFFNDWFAGPDSRIRVVDSIGRTFTCPLAMEAKKDSNAGVRTVVAPQGAGIMFTPVRRDISQLPRDTDALPKPTP